MKRILLAFVLVLGCQDDSYGCNRCGKVQCVYAAPVVHHAVAAPVYPTSVQNFVFQSNAAYPLIGGGSTAYFEPLKAEVYANQAARLSESAVELQKLSLSGVEKAASASIELEKQRSLYAALLQAAGKTSHQAQTFGLRVTTDSHGQVHVERLESIPEVQPQEVKPQAAVQSILSKRCFECHSGNTTKGDVDLQGVLSPEDILKVIDAVQSDKMPKDRPKLIPAEKGSILEQMLSDWRSSRSKPK